MASGLSMVVAYSVFEVSLIGGFAYFATAQAGPVRIQRLVVLAGRCS